MKPVFTLTTIAACALVTQLAVAETDTTFGGYGEIGYNRYTKDTSRSQADLKRFVLSLNHRFNDRITFNGEVEWEHAVTSKTDKGETEIEQAYLNYQFTNGLNLKTGLFLMPFGLLNQSHEPPVFYGVERNEVETRIIPTTWREGGVGLSGNTHFGLDWDTGVTTGFDIAKFNDAGSPLHSIHQELQQAKAKDPSFYGALNYRGIPGFLVGSAAFTGDSGQGSADYKLDPTQPNFDGVNARVTLWDAHTRWQKYGWDLEALYARGSISNADQIDQTLQTYNAANNSSRPFVPSQFYGWLGQAAYSFWLNDEQTLSPFVRYERYNTQSKMPTGFSSDPANADRVGTFGVSYKPIMQIVLKADYQKYINHPANDRFNLGMGYMF